MTDFSIAPIGLPDRELVRELLTKHWGAPWAATRGRLVDASALPGFLARSPDGTPLGLITLELIGQNCEVVTLDAFEESKGIGSALLKRGAEFAISGGASRLWLITSNDNIRALGFYQKRGLRLVQIHPDAVTESRKLKPQIPLVAENGIPIRDELEFELLLPSAK